MRQTIHLPRGEGIAQAQLEQQNPQKPSYPKPWSISPSYPKPRSISPSYPKPRSISPSYPKPRSRASRTLHKTPVSQSSMNTQSGSGVGPRVPRPRQVPCPRSGGTVSRQQNLPTFRLATRPPFLACQACETHPPPPRSSKGQCTHTPFVGSHPFPHFQGEQTARLPICSRFL
jgi:hypothetical protein